MDTPGDASHDDGHAGEPAANDPSVGLDTTTIALLVFFIALIVIVAALLLLPILSG
jgi:hypothetical protein